LRGIVGGVDRQDFYGRDLRVGKIVLDDGSEDEVGLVALSFEVVEDDLVEGWLLFDPGRGLSVSDGGVVIGCDLFDFSGQARETASLDGIDNRPMLFFHEGGDRFAVDILLDEVIVRGAAGLENLATRVDE
jgi:hypothetical protein